MLISGTSSSRLSELRKYTVSPIFANQYIGGGSPTVDGVDYAHSFAYIKVIYYLGGIKYTDMLVGSNSGTTFLYTPKGTGETNNFIYVPYYKDPKKDNIISNPKINDDVFIVRQELSAFEKNYKLEHIKSLVELETYASGKFFNIIKNS